MRPRSRRQMNGRLPSRLLPRKLWRRNLLRRKLHAGSQGSESQCSASRCSEKRVRRTLRQSRSKQRQTCHSKQSHSKTPHNNGPALKRVSTVARQCSARRYFCSTGTTPVAANTRSCCMVPPNLLESTSWACTPSIFVWEEYCQNVHVFHPPGSGKVGLCAPL